jgi:hypothetical protein
MEINQNVSPFVSPVPRLHLTVQARLVRFLSYTPQTMHEPFRVEHYNLDSDLNGC